MKWEDFLEREKQHKEDKEKTVRFFKWIWERYCQPLKDRNFYRVLEIGIGQSGGYLGIMDNIEWGVSIDPLYGDIKEKAEEIPFKNNYFDLIIASNVLDHCEDVLRVASEATRVLAPSGILFVFSYLVNGLHPLTFKTPEEIIHLFPYLKLIKQHHFTRKSERNEFVVLFFQK